MRPLTVLLVGGVLRSDPRAPRATSRSSRSSCTWPRCSTTTSSTTARSGAAATTPRRIWGNAVSVLAGDLLLTHALERTAAVGRPPCWRTSSRPCGAWSTARSCSSAGATRLDVREDVYFRVVRRQDGVALRLGRARGRRRSRGRRPEAVARARGVRRSRRRRLSARRRRARLRRRSARHGQGALRRPGRGQAHVAADPRDRVAARARGRRRSGARRATSQRGRAARGGGARVGRVRRRAGAGARGDGARAGRARRVPAGRRRATCLAAIASELASRAAEPRGLANARTISGKARDSSERSGPPRRPSATSSAGSSSSGASSATWGASGRCSTCRPTRSAPRTCARRSSFRAAR